MDEWDDHDDDSFSMNWGCALSMLAAVAFWAVLIWFIVFRFA